MTKLAPVPVALPIFLDRRPPALIRKLCKAPQYIMRSLLFSLLLAECLSWNPTTPAKRRRDVLRQQEGTAAGGPDTVARTTRLFVGDARGDYYGESAGSYMVKEFKYVCVCGSIGLGLKKGRGGMEGSLSSRTRFSISVLCVIPLSAPWTSSRRLSSWRLSRSPNGWTGSCWWPSSRRPTPRNIVGTRRPITSGWRGRIPPPCFCGALASTRTPTFCSGRPR
jgi:hypothetical protein